MAVSQEFAVAVRNAVERIRTEGVLGYKVTAVNYTAQESPTAEQKKAVNLQPDQKLLGLFASPNHVYLFEDGIRSQTASGRKLQDVVDDVADHEIYHHYLGYNDHAFREQTATKGVGA